MAKLHSCRISKDMKISVMNFRIFIALCLFVLIVQEQAKSQPPRLKVYNIVWTEQSKNSSESMPLVGGDAGCNVWVENGDVLLYLQRSGSLTENGEVVELQVTPESRRKDVIVNFN